MLIHPSEEGGFWATCPEVPGANGQGETEEEAEQDLQAAIQLVTQDQAHDAMIEESAWISAAARLGLTTCDAIVAWADSHIMRLDSPPYWLIELSTLRSDATADFAKIIESTAPRTLTTDEKVALAASAYLHSALGLQGTLTILFRILLSDADDNSPETPTSEIENLLVEWDCFESSSEINHGFISRCHSAFEKQLLVHRSPPSTIFHPPSSI